MTNPTRNEATLRRKFMAVLAISSAIFFALAAPAAASAQGYIEGQLGVGYFYGTFNQSPNVVLLAGGSAEDFCLAGPGADRPGEAPARFFQRDSGALDIKVNDKEQPIFLYEVDAAGPPEWLGSVCPAFLDGAPAPAPFATGIADLKVRTSVVSESRVEVFNSINGTATGADGTIYKVRAAADLVVENGIPVGNPEDFVSLDLRQIGR